MLLLHIHSHALSAQSHILPEDHPFIGLGSQVEPASRCRSGSVSLTGGQSVSMSPVHLSRDSWFELAYRTSLLHIHRIAYHPVTIVTHWETETIQSEWVMRHITVGRQRPVLYSYGPWRSVVWVQLTVLLSEYRAPNRRQRRMIESELEPACVAFLYHAPGSTVANVPVSHMSLSLFMVPFETRLTYHEFPVTTKTQ